MAFNPAEYLDWLPKEDQDAVMALFGKHPEAASKLEAKLTAAIDSQMAPLKTEYETRKRDLDAQFDTIDSIRGADSKTLDAVRTQAEQSAAKLAVAEQRIRTACAEAGLDPEPYLKDIAATTVKPEQKVETPMTFDPKDVVRQAGAAAFNALVASLDAQDIAQEHQKLFGEPLTNSKQLLRDLQERVKRTGNENLSLRDVWKETYKVEAKLAEVTEKQVQARIDAAVEKARMEEADKRVLVQDQTPPAHFGSPLLEAVLPKDRPVHVAGVPEAVLAAMKSYKTPAAA